LGSPVTLTWSSRPTRLYAVQKTAELSEPPPSAWSDVLGLVDPDAGPTTTRAFADPESPQRFFRIAAQRPLSP
jgi:hypothetical protein